MNASSQWQKIGIKNHHGIALPLFSLRSKTSCGIGDYLDLLPLIPWCRQIGLDVIQLLPLNDTGCETSPYSALSAYALNPIYLNLTSLSHQENIPGSDLLNQSKRISYDDVYQFKDVFLRNYYKEHGALIKKNEEYAQFKQKHDGWLQDYAIFKSLKVLQNWKNWEDWEPSLKNLSRESYQDLADHVIEEAEYQIFLQYLCFKQFEMVKSYANIVGVFIKGDIPILINRDSADVWSQRNLFKLEFSAGAPPDMYAAEGQKWGFPLYNFDEMEKRQYDWWIRRLHVAEHFYHIYRIDHVVGFFRIWSVPLDLPPKMGHFTPENTSEWIPQGSKLMEMMLKNSEMLPIGEDLGTIPGEVRLVLQKLGICGTKVMRWERRWNEDKGFIDPKNYIPESMTTVSTHDSENLTQWWKNQPEEASLYASTRGWQYHSILTEEQRKAILFSSHHSGSLFHINLLQEYLAMIPEMTWPDLDDERINVPGVIDSKNWTYRFRPSIEEMIQSSLGSLIKELL